MADAEDFDRGDARERARQDIERRERREPESQFWRHVGLVGSVGWPIVGLTVAGAFIGQWADRQWETGVRFTLTLLAIGATVGTWAAFRAMRRG